jgi:hypothetical protein
MRVSRFSLIHNEQGRGTMAYLGEAVLRLLGVEHLLPVGEGLSSQLLLETVAVPVSMAILMGGMGERVRWQPGRVEAKARVELMRVNVSPQIARVQPRKIRISVC